jgi:hypothetical protein
MEATRLLGIGVFFGILSVPLTAQPAIVLKAARVFDGEAMHEGWAIRVKGERIEAAGPAAGVDASGAKVMELSGATADAGAGGRALACSAASL